MQIFMYVEINVFALVILFLVYLNIHRHAEKYLVEQKLFITLLGLNALLLILDSIMWILDGKPGFFVKGLFLFITGLYYILNPVVCMVWSLYVDYQVYRSERRFKKYLIPILVPVLINTVFVFLSIFCNYLFYIDNNNMYHRGPLFLIVAAMSYWYLIFTLIFIINNRNKIHKQNFIPILVFAFPPFIGGIVQCLFYGISLIWVCMTISILIIFINIQNDQLYTDHLTGLFNRRQLDYYFWERTQSNPYKGLLGGIMIDLNSFKMINDLYGHHVGDQALQYAAKILKKSFKKDFISRYGGDEFVVILEIEDNSSLADAVNRLNENVKQFNSRTKTPYKIELSIGFDSYDCKSTMSPKEFITHIDSLMYKDKLNKKALSLINPK